MRKASSCSTCRLRRKKCIATASADACDFCTRTKMACDLSRYKQLGTRTSSSKSSDRAHFRTLQLRPSNYDHEPSTTLAYADITLQPLCDDLLVLYFEMLHNKQLILFHQRTFWEDYRAGTIPEYILLGILALVARFSTHSYFAMSKPHARAKPLLQRALQHFNSRTEAITLHALQGCVLLSFGCFVEGLHDQDSLLSAQAIRMVEVLQLPEHLSTDPIRREIETRLYWQVFMSDTWQSLRAQLPRRLIRKPHFPMPLEEETFENMRSTESEQPPEVRESSIWGHVVWLTETYAEVLDLVSIMVKRSELGFTIDSKVSALSQRLDSWLRRLPGHLLNTPRNLQASSDLGRGREFAVLHLVYHHQGQLLFYSYLQQFTAQSTSPADAKALGYAARCKAHAEALSQLMWTTNTTPGMECLWSPVNGHLIVVASSVHLHSLLFDHDPLQTGKIKSLLEQNFVMLLQFQSYWPTIRASISRLQAIHRSCSQGGGPTIFRMDDWTFDFLNNYDTPVLDRWPSPRVETASPPGSWHPDMTWPQISDGKLTIDSDLQLSLSFK